MSILQKIDASAAECQALVLAPTRELAQQIVKVVRALGDFMQLQVRFWPCCCIICLFVRSPKCFCFFQFVPHCRDQGPEIVALACLEVKDGDYGSVLCSRWGLPEVIGDL